MESLQSMDDPALVEEFPSQIAEGKSPLRSKPHNECNVISTVILFP
jgi:hypothetical protein